MTNIIKKLCAGACLATVVLTIARPATADIASVGYVRQYVTKQWDITIPHTAGDGNIVSMKYLMQVVDKANELLNGTPTSDYANDPTRATSNIVSINAARKAVDTLIKKNQSRSVFWFVPSGDGDTVSFFIGAAGNFVIDWDDGEVEEIETHIMYEEEMANSPITHTFKDGRPASEHKIGLGGVATDYGDFDVSRGIVSISIMLTGGYMVEGMSVQSIDGCLACVFPTLSDGRNPIFYMTFLGAQITSIPENLFDGLHGTPAPFMFAYTFVDTKIITVPENMFDWVTEGSEYMFNGTFNHSTLRTVPLFKNVPTGAAHMFDNTFAHTEIETLPDDMFASLTGEYFAGMFGETFSGNKKLITTVKIGPERKELWEMWPNLTVENQCTYLDSTSVPGYHQLPYIWSCD